MTRKKSDTSQSKQPKQSLPKKVQVLGTSFRVDVVDLGDELAGDTLGFLRRIRISSNSDCRRKWTTLVHEWIHAAMYINGVGSVVSNELEEIIAQSMEHVIEEMLRQIGPQLLESILEDLQ